MPIKEIPLLTKEDIECRVQSVKEGRKNKNKVGAILLLYKDARVDMRVLDDVYGRENWQRTHEVIAGNLFCNIDIWDAEKKAWVRKQDVGTESNTEKEKGQASDSFKRAGFNVGIGRELYTAPFIYVSLAPGEYYGEPPRLSQSLKFHVAEIAYNERREIVKLKIADNHGDVRYELGRYIKPDAPQEIPAPTPPKEKKLAPLPSASGFVCADCGAVLKTYKDSAGKTVSLRAHAMHSEEMFGKVLCLDCIKKRGESK